jgi:hypothetical protein
MIIPPSRRSAKSAFSHMLEEKKAVVAFCTALFGVTWPGHAACARTFGQGSPTERNIYQMQWILDSSSRQQFHGLTHSDWHGGENEFDDHD